MELEPVFAGSFELCTVYFKTEISEAWLRVGEYEKAKKWLRDLDEHTRRNGMRYWRGWGGRLRGELALKTESADAGRCFEKSIAICREIDAENELTLAYEGCGRFHRQMGDAEKAREYFTKALEIFERLGTLKEPDKVKKELEGL